MFHKSHVQKFVDDNSSRIAVTKERVIATVERAADEDGMFPGQDLVYILGQPMVDEIGYLIETDPAYLQLSAEALRAQSRM